MPFKKILKELVQIIPGASGAILTDWEGEAVEQYSLADEFELKLTGAHKGIILNRLREVQNKFTSGEIREAIVSTETHHIIIGSIDADYSLIMTLAKKSLVARALYEFQRAVESLKKEIC